MKCPRCNTKMGKVSLKFSASHGPAFYYKCDKCRYNSTIGAVYNSNKEWEMPKKKDGKGITKVFMICNAYESGYGHGFNEDGKDGKDGGYFTAPDLNEAYRYGYEQGLENKEEIKEAERIEKTIRKHSKKIRYAKNYGNT